MQVGDYDRNLNLFKRYVDDSIFTITDNPNKLLQEVNDLHPNLEFTLETQNDKSELAFLDMEVHVN